METLLISAASVVVGGVIGVLSGMLGLGGGTMIVPVLKLGYLLPPIVCTATSLVVVILTAISGAVTHVRRRTCLLKLGVAAGVGGACLSPVGVWLASLSPDWVIMAAAAAVIVYSSVTMFRKALKAPKGKKGAGLGAKADGLPGAKGGAAAGTGTPAGTGVPAEAVAPVVLTASAAASASGDAVGSAAPSPVEPVAAATTSAPGDGRPALPEVTPRQMGLGFAIGLLAGLLGGYVGVGGGFIMVPLFMQMLKTPMKLTSGTSLIAVLILAIPGAVTQGAMGNIDWMVAIALSLGAIPGAVIGSHLVSRVPERALRFLFSALLCVAAILLVVDQL